MPLITTPFGRSSTADDVLRGVDLTGRRAIVTGASSGIGAETARSLAAAGAEVTLAVRDVAAGERVAAGIRAAHPSARTRVRGLELADLASVAAFGRDWDGPLDVLVGNAGVMAVQDLQRSAQGHELQFAVNHLGHFALAVRLRPALASSGDARIVSVGSRAHLRSPVVLGDLDFRFRPYDPWSAYAQSKTANVLFAVAATARWASDGIVANALHPGNVVTGLGRHVGEVNTAGDLKSVAQGAATSVLLAASPLLAGVGGRWFDDCAEPGTVDARPADGRGVARYAVDPRLADLLWDASCRMVGP